MWDDQKHDVLKIAKSRVKNNENIICEQCMRDYDGVIIGESISEMKNGKTAGLSGLYCECSRGNRHLINPRPSKSDYSRSYYSRMGTYHNQKWL